MPCDGYESLAHSPRCRHVSGGPATGPPAVPDGTSPLEGAAPHMGSLCLRRNPTAIRMEDRVRRREQDNKEERTGWEIK